MSRRFEEMMVGGRKKEVRGQRSEVRGQRSEDRGQKSEVSVIDQNQIVNYNFL